MGLRLSGSAASTEEGAVPPVSSGSHAAGGPKPLLERSIYFIKERAGLLKLTDTYDILDPTTGHQIGIAKEEPHCAFQISPASRQKAHDAYDGKHL